MVQAGDNQGIAFAPDGTLYQNSDAAGAEGLYRIGEDGSAVRVAPFPGKGLTYVDGDTDYLASCDVTDEAADLRLFAVVEGDTPTFESTGTDLAAPCWDTFWSRANDRLYITLTNGDLAIVDDFSADAGANLTVDRTIVPANDFLEKLSVNLHGVAVIDRDDDSVVVLTDVGDAASADDGRVFVLVDTYTKDGPSLTGSISGPESMLGNPVDVLYLPDGTVIVAEKSNDLLLAFDGISLSEFADEAPSYSAAFDKPESIELVVPR